MRITDNKNKENEIKIVCGPILQVLVASFIFSINYITGWPLLRQYVRFWITIQRSRLLTLLKQNFNLPIFN